MFCQEIRLMYSYAFDVSPSLLHHFSIDTPSKLWTMYGVSVEYVWSIFEGRAKNLHIFFEEITPLLLGKNGKEEKRESPHRQGVPRNHLGGRDCYTTLKIVHIKIGDVSKLYAQCIHKFLLYCFLVKIYNRYIISFHKLFF